MSIEQLQRDVREIVSSLNVLLAERGYKQIGQPLTDEHSPEVVRPKWEVIPIEEKVAKWWRLETLASGVWCTAFQLQVMDGYKYRIVKTEKHPDNDKHARVKLEWDRVRGKGTHYLWCQPPKGTGFSPNANHQLWDKEASYEVRRYEDAPIAKKKIDKSKLPIGAMTNWGKVVDHLNDGAVCLDALRLRGHKYEGLRIVPMTQWEVLQDGDVIPEGLLGESARVDTFSGKTVVVYRITGIADGWTDE